MKADVEISAAEREHLAEALAVSLLEHKVSRFFNAFLVHNADHRAAWLAIAKVAQEQAELYD